MEYRCCAGRPGRWTAGSRSSRQCCFLPMKTARTIRWMSQRSGCFHGPFRMRRWLLWAASPFRLLHGRSSRPYRSLSPMRMNYWLPSTRPCTQSMVAPIRSPTKSLFPLAARTCMHAKDIHPGTPTRLCRKKQPVIFLMASRLSGLITRMPSPMSRPRLLATRTH